MNGIDRLAPAAGLTAPAAAATAESLARAMIGEVGARVVGWAANSFGGDAGAAWSAACGVGIHSPDPSRLAQGDVYGLRGLAGDLADKLGATPAQEGALLRALEDFTRSAALNVNALAGSDSQLAALSGALELSGSGDGVDGVVARLETATRRLDNANI
jgi:hypothetical protein